MASVLRFSSVVALGLALSLQSAGARAQSPEAEPRYDSPRGGVVAGGVGLAAVGIAGLVGGVLLLRTEGKHKASRARAAIGAGVAVLGGILLPVGLSLAAAGMQQVPTGTTVPRDSSQMVIGGVLSTIGGIALGGGAIVVARERGSWALPGGLAMLGAGNALIAVGLPMWVRGSQRVPSEPIDEAGSAVTARLRPFVRPRILAY